jgi:hypothetical protein
MMKSMLGAGLLVLGLATSSGCATRCDEAVSLCEACEPEAQRDNCQRHAEKSAEECDEMIAFYEALCGGE